MIRYSHIHLQLCLISRELNKIFSISMTLQMGCYFVLFVDVSRHIYRSYIDRNAAIVVGQVLDNVFTYIWGVVHNVKFLALNLMCQNLCNKVIKWNNCQLITINIERLNNINIAKFVITKNMMINQTKNC